MKRAGSYCTGNRPGHRPGAGISAARHAGIVLVAALALGNTNAVAEDMPVPPCAGPPNPSAGAVGESLNQLVLTEARAPSDWSPPACTGWAGGPTKALLGAAGRFRLSGDGTALVTRLLSISTLTEIVYWSTTRSRWRHLFKEATALAGPDRTAPRSDFNDSEFVAGATLFYWVAEDNPTTGVVIQMRVLDRTPDRIAFETTNVTPLRAKLLFFRPLVAAPGQIRQLYYIERENGDTWQYYSLIHMGETSTLAGTSAANYQNRAEAYFRYFAGLDMRREPPAAP